MKTTLFSLAMFVALASFLVSCREAAGGIAEKPGLAVDSLSVPGVPEPFVVFLDLNGGRKECDQELEALDARLHGQIAWLLGQTYQTVSEDSAGQLPKDVTTYKFYSTRKVAELRIRDAIKLKLKAPATGQLKMELFRNEGHTWTKYKESPPMPCTSTDSLIVKMLELLGSAS